MGSNVLVMNESTNEMICDTCINHVIIIELRI